MISRSVDEDCRPRSYPCRPKAYPTTVEPGNLAKRFRAGRSCGLGRENSKIGSRTTMLLRRAHLRPGRNSQDLLSMNAILLTVLALGGADSTAIYGGPPVAGNGGAYDGAYAAGSA